MSSKRKPEQAAFALDDIAGQGSEKKEKIESGDEEDIDEDESGDAPPDGCPSTSPSSSSSSTATTTTLAPRPFRLSLYQLAGYDVLYDRYKIPWNIVSIVTDYHFAGASVLSVDRLLVQPYLRHQHEWVEDTDKGKGAMKKWYRGSRSHNLSDFDSVSSFYYRAQHLIVESVFHHPCYVRPWNVIDWVFVGGWV